MEHSKAKSMWTKWGCWFGEGSPVWKVIGQWLSNYPLTLSPRQRKQCSVLYFPQSLLYTLLWLLKHFLLLPQSSCKINLYSILNYNISIDTTFHFVLRMAGRKGWRVWQGGGPGPVDCQKGHLTDIYTHVHTYVYIYTYIYFTLRTIYI